MANGSSNSNFYIPGDLDYTAGCVAYTNFNGLLSANVNNRWCQSLVDNLQLFIGQLHQEAIKISN